MASISNLYRGLIIEVDLDPTKGSETGKVRPCIIVTNDVYNARVPVIQVVPLTEWTEKKSKIKTNVTIEISVANGLRKKCNFSINFGKDRLPKNPKSGLKER